MILLVVLQLSAEIPHLLGVLPQSEISHLLAPYHPLAGDYTGEDLSYSLSPWPWESDVFIPTHSALTELIIRLEINSTGIVPFDQRQTLILERVTSLWEGKIIFELALSETLLESLSTETAMSSFLLQLKKLKENNLYEGINWDLKLSSNRTDFSVLEMLIKGIGDFGGAPLTHYYSLGRYDIPVEPIQEISHFTIIKAFDFSGRHSTLENAEESIESFIVRKGYDRSTLILGLPLYGRKFRSTDPGYWSDTMSYRDIVEKYQPSPESNEEDYYYFNGPQLALKKAILSLEKKLAGVALYELQWDDRGAHSLLKAVSSLRD